MTLDYIIKEMIRSLEKLQEASTSSEIMDEITILTIPPTLSISGTVKGVNEFAISPAVALALSGVDQGTGTFLVGSARCGFSDVG